MLKRSYVFLANILISILILSLSVKAAQVWLSSERLPEERLEEGIALVEAEKIEPIKKAKLSLSDYQVLEEQNLFHSTRKTPKEVPLPAITPQPVTLTPTPQVIPTPQPVNVNPPTVIFYGTAQEGEDRYALLQDKTEQKPQKYRLNEEIDGYVITEIRRNQITLSKQGKDFPIKLWDLNASNRSGGGPVIQSPILQQPLVQQPTFIPTPIAPSGLSGRISRGRPLPYTGLPPGQQIPQPLNPGRIQPWQRGYPPQQLPPEVANQYQDYGEQEFQDSEYSEEETFIEQPGLFQPEVPNLSSPDIPVFPSLTPTPFVIPGVNQ